MKGKVTHVSHDGIGTVYGIGVGPGDPELITVKAHRLIQESPVIAYPKKRMGGKSYALEIVEQYINPSEKAMLGLVFPMTRDKDVLYRQWNEIVDTVWEELSQGRNVAFVTEGDPMLYSTFIHMSRLLKQRYPHSEVVSVPGVSSINAAASRMDVPLADGDETVAIVPATKDLSKMRTVLEMHDCVIFIKVSKVLDSMIDLLSNLELIDKAVVATRVTASEEMIWNNVQELRGADLNYLTLMVVRK